VSRANKRLYFLKQLKRAGVPPQQLLHFYTAVIRPVLKYASSVWHYAINRAQSQHLESIQKRALHIIFNFTCGFPYSSILFVAGLNSLEDRHNLSRSFFQSISQPDSCLHHLFPPLRVTSLISRLRSTTPYPRPPSRTKNTNHLLTLHLIITSHLLLLFPQFPAPFLLTCPVLSLQPLYRFYCFPQLTLLRCIALLYCMISLAISLY